MVKVLGPPSCGWSYQPRLVLDTNGIELDFSAADSELQTITDKCYLCGDVFKADILVFHIRRSL